MKDPILFQHIYDLAALLAKANQQFCQNWLAKETKAAESIKKKHI